MRTEPHEGLATRMGRENEVYDEGVKQGEHSLKEKNLQSIVPAVKSEVT